MLAIAVAGIDDAGVHIAAEEGRGPACAVANYDDINTHGLEVLGGIQQGLAFADGAGLFCKLYDVGTQSACGEGKAVSGSGAVFKKQIDDNLASERGRFFDGACAYLLKTFGGVKDMGDLFDG
jgi:hypothetical protein